MHLRPRDMTLNTNGLRIDELPGRKTAEQVVGDFLRYLLKETVHYIQTRHADGVQLWEQVKDRAKFVLGHPNGWVGRPQQRLRESAICGGLIPDTSEGRARVTFVTEGEASALACLASGLGPSSLEVSIHHVSYDTEFALTNSMIARFPLPYRGLRRRHSRYDVLSCDQRQSN